MNAKILAALAALAVLPCGAEVRPLVVKGAPFELTVAEWIPPEREFPITDYGARPDGRPVTEAMDRAIAAANAAGGGRVTVPKGEWTCGAFRLRSDVALVLADGAVLRFPDDPVVVYRAPLRENGLPQATCSGLIQANGCTNIAVMGKGTIKCDVEYWHRNFMVNPQRGFPRPQMMHLANCDRIRLEGFKVRGSPAWTLHLMVCNDILLRDVDSVCTGPNTDGLDLESCNRALVEGCSLDQTDDTYTIKSGFNEAGRRRGIPTQNVVIRNCRAVHGHSLLGIGSEVSGGIRNIYMADCTVESECWNWLFVKTDAKRGASVENVWLENVRGRLANQAVMNVEMAYDGNPNKELTKKAGQRWVTAISNVVCRNVACGTAAFAVRVNGDESLPPRGLVAENIRIGRLREHGALVKAKSAPDLVTRNVKLDPTALAEVLDLPANVRPCDPAKDADPEVVFTREELDELADNAAIGRVLEARIAAEVKCGRNCAPTLTPVDFGAMPERLEGNHMKRVGEALAELGCALPGALVADDVRRVCRAGEDGSVAGMPGLKVSVEPDEERRTIRVRIANGTAQELKDVLCSVHLPQHLMTHKQVVRVPRIAAGGTFVRELEFGAGAHYLPRPVGLTPYAAEADFTLSGTRTRVWATKYVPVDEPFALPYRAARCVGPTDVLNADDERLMKLSGETGALPALGKGEDAEWRVPYFPGSQWYNVTGPSRPYTAKERDLVRAGRAMEVVALQFNASERAKVMVRVLPRLWDAEMSLFLNGERVALPSKMVSLPAKPGLNRLIARFRSKPGERKACAQLAVFTCSVTDHVECVPFSGTNARAAVRADGPVRFALEWNATYAAEIPYEVEISRAKLADLAGVPGDTGFKVTAQTASGGVPVPVRMLPGRTAGTVFLRFTPPEGTLGLVCEAAGRAEPTDPESDDNLFAGAMADVARWKPSPRMKLEKDGGALRFTAREGGSPEAVILADVPPGVAGRDVRFEAELENLTDESWAVEIRLGQLDAKGNRLPESVSDGRWTSLMQPARARCPFSERGHVHPEARKLRFRISLRSSGKPFDVYGIPNAKPYSFQPSFRLSRLSVRPAERLPFPKYDDGNFAPGVSGAAGDFALALGGADEKAFWYQTRSIASWSDGVPLRREEQLFYPIGAGTVEAWFKSDWRPVRSGGTCRAYPLFQNYQAYRQVDCRGGKGNMMFLAYRPDPGELVFEIADYTGRKYEGRAAAKLPNGKWCHVAVQWAPAGSAEVFVDGSRALEVAIPEWKVPDLANEDEFRRPNDEGGHELYVGSNFNGTRWTVSPDPAWPYVEGWVDALRVSTGKRYAGAFKPAKSFACDRDTRALFTFDRTFDGVSGGGLGWIPGTTRGIRTGRVARELSLVSDASSSLQYWPKEVLPENDPRVVFDIVNFPKLPTPADFEAARRPFSRSATLKAGEALELDCPEGTVTDYVEIANEGDGPLVHPIVLNEGDVDPRSYGDLADTLGLEGLSPRERVNKTFAFVLSSMDYFMNHTAMFKPGSDVPSDVEYKAMLMFNGYCGFECGPLNNMAANLFVNVARCPAVQTAGYGHSFEEVFYDGKNHVYDLSAQKFFPAMDNETAAYLEEGGDEAGVFPRMGNPAEHFMRRSHRGHWLQTPDCVAKVGVTLNPGESFRVWQVNDGHCNDLVQRTKSGPYRGSASKFRPDYTVPCHAETEKVFLQRAERFFPQYLNGFIAFSGRPAETNPAFGDVAADSFCYKVDAGGYPIVHAEYDAVLADGSKAALELSTDGGKSFRPLASPADYAVRARYAYLVRVKAPMAKVVRFRASTEVQLNPRIFPGRLRAGRNRLTLKQTAGGMAKVTVRGRAPAARISIPAAVSSGTVVGAETLFYAFDPKDSPELEVKGVGPAATARTSGAVVASLADGKLRLSGDPKDGVHFAGVTIVENGAEKELTVLIGPDVRLGVAKDATVKSGARLLPPDATSPQTRARFSPNNHGAAAVFGFDPIPAGRYSVLELNRFRSHPETEASDRMRVIWPGQKSFALGQPRNWACNYKKANYGRPGERANFKWDYADHPGTGYPYACLRVAEYPAADRLEVRSWRDDEVEVVAVLVVPECSADVRGEIVRNLCGFNTNPWRIRGVPSL